MPDDDEEVERLISESRAIRQRVAELVDQLRKRREQWPERQARWQRIRDLWRGPASKTRH
jgi:hypothetical protein